ncbi:RNA-binding motif, single-stranded-interacting protein 3 [Chelonia mydas]|uniref:RNA-binding motif, single-stranded-interacting protein 3 n=1 Tax=Chelonia mydas TaxID=8469 RepID=M7B610_CHEMY|nr:RNA-binding motif, single-stranded-interacting protein 3 [Chelonia mydas]
MNPMIYSVPIEASNNNEFSTEDHLGSSQSVRYTDWFHWCCDNANNGPHYVNAASKHDGPSDPTDESPVLGHNRNGYYPALEYAPLTPLTSLVTRGTYPTYMTAAAPMQGTYIPQYTPVPATAVPIEGVVAETSPQTVASSSQEASGQQQQMTVETSSEHAPAYSYQQSNDDIAE